MSSAPIVVTGAAGFIGCNTVEELNRRGYSNLIFVDTLGVDEKWKNLTHLRYEDLIEPKELLTWLQSQGAGSVEAIVHLGACSSTTERDADYLMDNNYRYTRRLCEWALESSTRFIYASSAATYGDGSFGFSDADENTVRLEPLNMYGYSKHAFDLWALSHNLFDRIVGLKFFNVFGPHEGHKGDMRSVVAKAYDEIRSTGELALFKSYRDDIADGEQRRDFIHVGDAVGVIMHFLDAPSASGLVNCGTGIARTWLDLAHAVFEALDQPEAIRFIDMPEGLREKYQYFTEADTRKLRDTGFADDFRTLEAGVHEYVTDYLVLQR